MKKKMLPIVICVVIVVLIIIIFVINNFSSNKEDVGKEFYESTGYNKIINHKDSIKSVTKMVDSEGEITRTEYDIDKAYDKIKKMIIVKKTNISVLDSSTSYLFEFEDGSFVSINFEGSYLKYNNFNYEVEYKN